ncbi:MAG: Hpt domain-containing protein [Alphaproteobacteria bacterium]|nr:Hpt domain-containing protein [Alphaproteobacteria bacterium]
MKAPVDLTNLREMTGGDGALEQTLFEEFYVYFEGGIRALQSACAAGADEEWRKQMHALKGIALNLGAYPLSELCKQAEENYLSPRALKERMIPAIHTEYKRVSDFLKNSAA